MVLKQIKDLKRDEKRSFHQLISFFIPAKRFYDAVHKAKEAGRAGNKSVEKEQIVVAHNSLRWLLKNSYRFAKNIHSVEEDLEKISRLGLPPELLTQLKKLHDRLKMEQEWLSTQFSQFGSSIMDKEFKDIETEEALLREFDKKHKPNAQNIRAHLDSLLDHLDQEAKTFLEWLRGTEVMEKYVEQVAKRLEELSS